MQVESFVVCIVGNLFGTRCRGDVKVLWCHSYLAYLVIYGSIPKCACRKLFCDFSIYKLMHRSDRKIEPQILVQID